MTDIDAKNRETSRVEVERFKNAQGPYFAYWQDPKEGQPKITTWTGDTLAFVHTIGDEYQCPAFGHFPTTRVNFRARDIHGREWYGTYYKSSGNYVRMRLQACITCKKIKAAGGFGPSHNGSWGCKSGSIASGGTRSHCTCDTCF